MGILQVAADHPLVHELRAQSVGVQAAILFFGFIALAVTLNVINQMLPKSKTEPPMVFHWFPFIGSTITYGMDPPTFFHANREKVHTTLLSLMFIALQNHMLTSCSTATSLASSCSAKRPPLQSAPPVTNSSSTASSRTSMPRRFTPS